MGKQKVSITDETSLRKQRVRYHKVSRHLSLTRGRLVSQLSPPPHHLAERIREGGWGKFSLPLGLEPKWNILAKSPVDSRTTFSHHMWTLPNQPTHMCDKKRCLWPCKKRRGKRWSYQKGTLCQLSFSTWRGYAETLWLLSQRGLYLLGNEPKL